MSSTVTAAWDKEIIRISGCTGSSVFLSVPRWVRTGTQHRGTRTRFEPPLPRPCPESVVLTSKRFVSALFCHGYSNHHLTLTTIVSNADCQRPCFVNAIYESTRRVSLRRTGSAIRRQTSQVKRLFRSLSETKGSASLGETRLRVGHAMRATDTANSFVF